jgi:hypothetical protein
MSHDVDTKTAVDPPFPRRSEVAKAKAACHCSAAVMLLRSDADVFGHPSPLVPLGELEVCIAIAEVFRGQLDAGCAIGASLAVREAQCRAAAVACRTMNFSVRCVARSPRRCSTSRPMRATRCAAHSVHDARRRATAPRPGYPCGRDSPTLRHAAVRRVRPMPEAVRASARRHQRSRRRAPVRRGMELQRRRCVALRSLRGHAHGDALRAMPSSSTHPLTTASHVRVVASARRVNATAIACTSPWRWSENPLLKTATRTSSSCAESLSVLLPRAGSPTVRTRFASEDCPSVVRLSKVAFEPAPTRRSPRSGTACIEGRRTLRGPRARRSGTTSGSRASLRGARFGRRAPSCDGSRGLCTSARSRPASRQARPAFTGTVRAGEACERKHAMASTDKGRGEKGTKRILRRPLCGRRGVRFGGTGRRAALIEASKAALARTFLRARTF